MNRLVRVILISGALLALSAAPTLASHGHVMQVGNGQCVLIAANGGEGDVVLPQAVYDGNPNVDIAPAAGFMHPLHVLVHRGVPGDHNSMAVAGSGGAATLCASGIVND